MNEYRLTAAEVETIEQIAEAVAVPYAVKHTITMVWTAEHAVTETFALDSERIIYLSEIEEVCNRNHVKMPAIQEETENGIFGKNG